MNLSNGPSTFDSIICNRRPPFLFCELQPLPPPLSDVHLVSAAPDGRAHLATPPIALLWARSLRFERMSSSPTYVVVSEGYVFSLLRDVAEAFPCRTD